MGKNAEKSRSVPRYAISLLGFGILLSPFTDGPGNYYTLLWITDGQFDQVHGFAHFLANLTVLVPVLMTITIALSKGRWTWAILAVIYGVVARIWTQLWQSFGKDGEYLYFYEFPSRRVGNQEWVANFWRDLPQEVALSAGSHIAFFGVVRAIWLIANANLHRFRPRNPEIADRPNQT